MYNFKCYNYNKERWAEISGKRFAVLLVDKHNTEIEIDQFTLPPLNYYRYLKRVQTAKIAETYYLDNVDTNLTAFAHGNTARIIFEELKRS